MPVTVPAALTVAMAVLLLLHVPPATPSVRVMVAPVHTELGPDMEPAVGAAVMVTVVVVVVLPQLLVTV